MQTEKLSLWQMREQERGQRLDALRATLNEADADPVRHGAADITDHFDRLLAVAEPTAKP